MKEMKRNRIEIKEILKYKERFEEVHVRFEKLKKKIAV